MTDVHSFAVLEPTADAFRNYYSDKSYTSPTEMMVDKADLLTLTVPEMTVLVGGMRALNANAGQSKHGVLTDKPGTLNNDFFVNLLDMSTKWQKSEKSPGVYEGLDRASGQAEMDSHLRRSDLRLQLRVARSCGSLCGRRRQGKVRE